MVKPNLNEELPFRIKELFCQRIQRLRTPQEHGACPYCFGDERAIASGRRELFCDYRGGRDPIQFGFPEECERHERG